MKNGFSLIELLIVLTLTAIISISAVALFFTTLLGGGKTATYEYTKQVGDHTLNQISSILRNARKLQPNMLGQECEIDMESVAVQAQDLQHITLTLDNGRIASTSAFMTPSDVVVADLAFPCARRTDGSPPQITVTFTLSKTGEDGRARNSVVIPFQTAVTMRNWF